MFEIDFKRLVAQLLPMSLRRPVIFGILRAGVSGVEQVYKDFTAARREHNFRLTHTGQVCYLRGVLTNSFGAGFKIGNVRQEGNGCMLLQKLGKTSHWQSLRRERGCRCCTASKCLTPLKMILWYLFQTDIGQGWRK